MAETKINANQTNITASDIGAASTAQLANKQDIMQYSTMPTASADNVDDIVQFVGTTDSTYTNGYFYKCTESSGSYSWVQTDVQPSSGGSSYTAGTGINITNDVISTSNYVVVNGSRYNVEGVDSVAISYNYTGATRARAVGSHSFAVCNNSYATDTGSLAIGYETKSQGYATIAMGVYSEATQRNCIAVGAIAKATADYAIQIGGFGKTNNDANTVKFANANGNYEIMSADGTIPEARLADTTNAAQGMVLTLDSNLNAVWQAGGSGGGISDVTVNGTSVVSGGVATITCATIDDASTSSQTATWSANKLNTTIGNIETLLAAI